MYAVRLFAARHARGFEIIYKTLERFFLKLHPLLSAVGYDRLEKPVALIEKVSKGLLFDCQMCGQCVLSSTGMSCPMNCPKNVRNGPCGGVRPGGFCEVNAHMRCVWVEGWNGARAMDHGLDRIRCVQPPVNRELAGSSSWLRVLREKAALMDVNPDAHDLAKSAMAGAFAKAREIEPGTSPLAKEPEAALSEQAVDEQTSVHAPENKAPK